MDENALKVTVPRYEIIVQPKKETSKVRNTNASGYRRIIEVNVQGCNFSNYIKLCLRALTVSVQHLTT